MKKIAQLNNRGQLTLPKTVRDVLDLKEEDYVDLELDVKNKSLTITKNVENVYSDKHLFDLLQYFITTNKNVIILVQGVSGSGKTYFSKLLLKSYLELLGVEMKTEGNPADWMFNQDQFVLEDESYGLGLVNQLEDKLTVITNQRVINIEKDSLLKESNRPIISIEFNNQIRGTIDSVKFYPNITESSNFMYLQNAATKISEYREEK